MRSYVKKNFCVLICVLNADSHLCHCVSVHVQLRRRVHVMQVWSTFRGCHIEVHRRWQLQPWPWCQSSWGGGYCQGHSRQQGQRSGYSVYCLVFLLVSQAQLDEQQRNDNTVWQTKTVENSCHQWPVGLGLRGAWTLDCITFLTPWGLKEGWVLLMSPPCVESQGCHLMPLFCLLSLFCFFRLLL